MGESWPGPMHLGGTTWWWEQAVRRAFSQQWAEEGKGSGGDQVPIEKAHSPPSEQHHCLGSKPPTSGPMGTFHIQTMTTRKMEKPSSQEKGGGAAVIFYLQFPGPKFIASRSALEFTGSHFNKTYFDHEANSEGVRTKKMSLLSVLLILHH